ncbi:MAG: hypothetical protein R2750_02285 [Bacteroidales bacterium]
MDCLYPSLGDDEDGVNLPAVFAPGSTQIIDVTASVNGYLDIWMDFNGNNSWADAGEHILANSVTGAGLNTILFFVPFTGCSRTILYAFQVPEIIAVILVMTALIKRGSGRLPCIYWGN